jgi:lipoprotein signal peptidase
VFNVADVGVTIGALLLVLFLWDEAEPAARAAPE